MELFLTSVPEFSVVFRFRAYSRRHETEPESISPQDVLRPGGRRARWLLRDGAVQRQSAVQRVAKIGILERGPSLRAGSWLSFSLPPVGTWNAGVIGVWGRVAGR